MEIKPTIPTRDLLDKILFRLRTAKAVVIMVHQQPDGDALGSLSALLSALTARGIRAVGCCDDAIPRAYRFLPLMDQVFQPSELPDHPYDRAVVVDCGDVGRVGDAQPLLTPIETVINIDHHVGNTCFGHLNWVDPTAAATGELIMHLIEYAGWAVDGAVATALYTSIVTDTGSFRFANTTAATLRVAATLREQGAAVGVIMHELYERRSLASMRLLASVLPSMALSDDGRVAWLAIAIDDMNRCGANQEDLDGLLDYPRAIDGVEVAILFRQIAPGRIKVGLRANGGVDVYAVAAHFGGGGHRKASGCTFHGDLHQAQAAILLEVQRAVIQSMMTLRCE